jgi:hypothetical protein
VDRDNFTLTFLLYFSSRAEENTRELQNSQPQIRHAAFLLAALRTFNSPASNSPLKHEV